MASLLTALSEKVSSLWLVMYGLALCSPVLPFQHKAVSRPRVHGWGRDLLGRVGAAAREPLRALCACLAWQENTNIQLSGLPSGYTVYADHNLLRRAELTGARPRDLGLSAEFPQRCSDAPRGSGVFAERLRVRTCLAERAPASVRVAGHTRVYSENIWYIETAALNRRDLSTAFAFLSKLRELYFEPSDEALTQQA